MTESGDATIIMCPVANRASRYYQTRAIESLERAGWTVRIATTQRPGHAIDLARDAAHCGAAVVVAAGGDGTVSEVAHGLAGTGTALGVLPLGLANVWAREIGVATIPRALDALVHGLVRRVDLGLANGRHFLLMASLGLDTLTLSSMSRPTIRRLGYGAYVASIIRALATFRGVSVELALPDRTLRRRAILLLIGNTRLYAGRVELTSEALADDGMLDLCLLDYRDPASMLRSVLALLNPPHRPAARA